MILPLVWETDETYGLVGKAVAYVQCCFESGFAGVEKVSIDLVRYPSGETEFCIAVLPDTKAFLDESGGTYEELFDCVWYAVKSAKILTPNGPTTVEEFIR